MERHLVEKVEEHEGGINCMALSEDGSVLLTGAEDCSARLWTTRTERATCLGSVKANVYSAFEDSNLSPTNTISIVN
jgi:WD40 repeat protein